MEQEPPMPVSLKAVALPDFGALGEQPDIPAATYEARAADAYRRAGVDWLAVYADREHFGNIMFLSGFEPRFEEAFLLIGANGRRVLITGNESESYAAIARLPGLTVLRSQTLSLMAQDRTREPRLADRLRDAGVKAGDSIGFVGWKYLEPEEDEDFSNGFFVPAAYVQMFRGIVGAAGRLGDATAILMHPETGLRATIDAEQIAAFEWVATRVSLAVWRIVSGVREGMSEFDAVARMAHAGDPSMRTRCSPRRARARRSWACAARQGAGCGAAMGSRPPSASGARCRPARAFSIPAMRTS
jgi:hypothetical protein